MHSNFWRFTGALALSVVACSANLGAAAPRTPSKAVLVTGASSGIGKRITQHLSSQGYFVYAGARKQKDLDALNSMENVEAIRLDVTLQVEIDRAVVHVTRAGRGLHGVVNNAGVAVLQPLIEVAEKDLAFQFDVNVYGPYRITKGFSPLLIDSGGRVVNISSISGTLSSALAGPYSMSKHALEAYNDSLALEMDRVGVRVVAVEPGNYASDIGKNAKKRMEATKNNFADSLFSWDISSVLDSFANREGMAEPTAVARAVEHALFSKHPKARYLVVPNQQEAEATIRKAMQEMLELNQDHAFSYDRDALIKIMDDLLEKL